MNKLLSYWKETWQQDKVLFFTEAAGTLVAMIGSLALNLFANSPPMLFILCSYFISDVIFAYSSYKRKSSFMVSLMVFYGLASLYGIYILCT